MTAAPTTAGHNARLTRNALEALSRVNAKVRRSLLAGERATDLRRKEA